MLKVKKYVLLLITSLFLLSSFILGIGHADEPEGLPESKLAAYADIFKKLAGDSLYSFTNEGLALIHECILKKASLSIKIPRGTKLTEDLFVENCFSPDQYAKYESYEQRKKDIESIDPQKLVEKKEIDSGTGYLKIERFKPGVAEYGKLILEDFNNKGVRALIIDLRGNRGGEVPTAVSFLKFFSPDKDRLIVELKDRNEKLTDGGRFLTDHRGEYAEWKIVVFVDGNTASAAEIVAGVLQLWGAKVVGTKTTGKGTVQTGIPISDGGWFFFTSDKYYFENGKTADGVGITPDVEVLPENSTKRPDPNISNTP